jgi:RNA polymerase sigma factor (sigma-70 family)
VEASALPPSAALARTRLGLGAPLLRLRSDEQLVSLFRTGSEEAFRAIHDRYRQRMFAYTRQMLSRSSVDAEDAVQEIFVRAYSGLRSSNRELALRAWLYRIAHNRCIDELRRPQSAITETIPATVPNSGSDPVARLEQRDALQRLIADVQRLPDQQRSALLMRELAGMAYADVAGALGVSVPAVKSLLVRARVGLAQASEARDTACARIREDLIVAHDRGVRTSGLVRRHLRDCPQCREFRSEVRGVSRQLAAFVPALGPVGVVAKLLGIGSAGGGGAAAGTSAIAGSGATATAAATTAAGGVAGSSAALGLGALAGTGHVVTLLAAAVVTAGGALELQHIGPAAPHHVRHHHAATVRTPSKMSHPRTDGTAATASSPSSSATQAPSSGAGSAAPTATVSSTANPLAPPSPSTATGHRHSKAAARRGPLDLTETLDPDQLQLLYGPGAPSSLTNPANPTASTSTPTSTSGSTPTSTSSTTGTGSTGTGSTGSTPTGSATGTPPTGSATGTPTGTTPPSSATTGTVAGGTSGSSTPGTVSSSTPVSSENGTSPTSSTGSGQTGSSSTRTVRPATSIGSIDPAKRPAAAKPHGHGTIAVFTMTGN